MNRPFAFALIVSLAFTMTACPGPWADRNGKFQATPVNLEEFNSEFDDYNSNLAQNKYGQDYLIFSSNRERKDKFNLVVKPFEYLYNDRTDQLRATAKPLNGNLTVSQNGIYYNLLTKKANQNCNVLGPLLIPINQLNAEQGGNLRNRYILLYADDLAGNLQIKFVHNLQDENVAEGPFEVKWLNGPKDDAYPTLSNDYSRLYFCSDRDGDFDIFEVDLSHQSVKLIEILLSDEPRPIVKNKQLSSSYDDKCPYVINGGWSEAMYFTSNRPGGQGGFDLYYALNDGKKWIEPVNMGARINTKYDEYRPIVPLEVTINFNYHPGIFSSNRPGGKGGFDLYMAGFLKQNETKL